MSAEEKSVLPLAEQNMAAAVGEAAPRQMIPKTMPATRPLSSVHLGQGKRSAGDREALPTRFAAGPAEAASERQLQGLAAAGSACVAPLLVASGLQSGWAQAQVIVDLAQAVHLVAVCQLAGRIGLGCIAHFGEVDTAAGIEDDLGALGAVVAAATAARTLHTTAVVERPGSARLCAQEQRPASAPKLA